MSLWINGIQSQRGSSLFNVGAISWVGVAQPSNFPVTTLSNPGGEKVGVVVSTPVVLFSATSYSAIPNAMDIVDITTPTSPEGPYYLGHTSGASQPALWCYNFGNLSEQPLEGALPDCGSANPVITRRVNNSLRSPDSVEKSGVFDVLSGFSSWCAKREDGSH